MHIWVSTLCRFNSKIKTYRKKALLSWPIQNIIKLYSCCFCLVFGMLSCASVYWCLVVNCWERADLLALLMPCGQLLGKGWPLGFIDALWFTAGKGLTLGSCWWCLLYSCYFPMLWYPGSGVVLDFIVFWTLPSFLLLSVTIKVNYS